MINSQIFFKKLCLMSFGVALMMVLVDTARADEQVTRRHTFELDDIDTVVFSNSVGRFEIIPTDNQEMRITLDIEASERGFFRRSVDIDDMDIKVKERGDTLYLSFDEKDASAEWLVEMPAVARTSVEMGVGEVRLEIGATELDVELGVGEIDVYAPENAVGRIDLDAGIGDADVRGGEVIRRDSAFISESIRAEGKGSNRMNVEVGVGDISVRLN